ncbi:IS30 family transposase [Acetobacter nitrogenifigens]
MRLVRDPVLAERVLASLFLLWSPEQICGRLRHENVRLSPETVYRWIYCRDMRERQLWKRLRRHHVKRWRRHQRRSRGLRIPPERRIAQRPQDIAARRIAGHWEADLVLFRAALNGQRNVMTLVERTTRFVRLARLEDRASRGVARAMQALTAHLPTPLAASVSADGHSSSLERPLGSQSHQGPDERNTTQMPRLPHAGRGDRSAHRELKPWEAGSALRAPQRPQGLHSHDVAHFSLKLQILSVPKVSRVASWNFS